MADSTAKENQRNHSLCMKFQWMKRQLRFAVLFLPYWQEEMNCFPLQGELSETLDITIPKISSEWNSTFWGRSIQFASNSHPVINILLRLFFFRFSLSLSRPHENGDESDAERLKRQKLELECAEGEDSTQVRSRHWKQANKYLNIKFDLLCTFNYGQSMLIAIANS